MKKIIEIDKINIEIESVIYGKKPKELKSIKHSIKFKIRDVTVRYYKVNETVFIEINNYAGIYDLKAWVKINNLLNLKDDRNLSLSMYMVELLKKYHNINDPNIYLNKFGLKDIFLHILQNKKNNL